MIGLLILKKYTTATDYTWVSTITNSGQSLTFAGTTDEAQYNSVNALAQAMKMGNTEVRFAASKIFNPPGGNMEAQELIGDWLDMSQSLFLNGFRIWASVDGSTMGLAKNLEEAAEIFLEAF